MMVVHFLVPATVHAWFWYSAMYAKCNAIPGQDVLLRKKRLLYRYTIPLLDQTALSFQLL